MTVLRTHGIGVAWSASVPVLEEVSVVLDRGLYGLVGANGAGKTTLLAILAGALAPHDGHIELRPRDSIVAYCQQRVDSLDDDVVHLSTRDDASAAELRGRLSLDPSELTRWPSLSPGERKRWQIAAALAREPDVLLLDEPTNHLDTDARRSVLAALRRFTGIGVVVSHDRSVLDAITHATLRIHARNVTVYPGPYSRARLLWEHERARREEAHADALAHVRRAESRLDDARRAHAAAARSTGARTQMKSKNDHDGRSMLAKGRALAAEKRAGRSVGIIRDAVDRARIEVPEIERDDTLGSRVFATFQRAPNAVLFHLDRDEIRAGDHVVLRNVRLTIAREDRVRIEGANGAGKTTLLESLLGSSTRADRILYLPQEIDPSATAALFDRVATSDPDTRGRLLSIVAALGSDPERIVRGHGAHLSPGETRKLALAAALAHQVWALVLDEPTNHMDLPSIERLESALETYPGCVIVVTHDDAFARAVTTRSLVVADGGVR